MTDHPEGPRCTWCGLVTDASFHAESGGLCDYCLAEYGWTATVPESPDTPDWEAIADGLMRALESFMSRDGYGAEDSNVGDWKAADAAEAAYHRAKGLGEHVEHV